MRLIEFDKVEIIKGRLDDRSAIDRLHYLIPSEEKNALCNTKW